MMPSKMAALQSLPSFMVDFVSGRMPSEDHDRARDGGQGKCLVGSLEDFKLTVKLDSNEGGYKPAFTIDFKPQQPALISLADTNGVASTEQIKGTAIKGFAGVFCKVISKSSQAVKEWTGHPNQRANYGRLAFRIGESVVESHPIQYGEQYLLCQDVIAGLAQFSESLVGAKKNAIDLADYCLSHLEVWLEPSVVLEVGFIPVYETWAIEIDHDEDSTLATAAGVVATVAAVVAVTIAALFLWELVVAGGVTATAISGATSTAALPAATAVPLALEVPVVSSEVLTGAAASGVARTAVLVAL